MASNSNGYGWNSQSALKLPDKIQCSRCDTWKTQTAYAKNRLQKLVSPYNPNQSKNQRDMKNIRIPCINCTGMQASEIECIQCGKKKSVEYFSGQQRKQPDMAKCNACMHAQVHKDGNDENDDEDDDDDSFITSINNLSVRGSENSKIVGDEFVVAPSSNSRSARVTTAGSYIGSRNQSDMDGGSSSSGMTRPTSKWTNTIEASNNSKFVKIKGGKNLRIEEPSDDEEEVEVSESDNDSDVSTHSL